MGMVFSYIKELLSSFIDENLKKIWFIFKGTILTLITAILKPCYPFPMPQKRLLEEITVQQPEGEEANSNGLLHDINFTKNTILVLITLMVGDAASGDFSSQVQGNVTKGISILLYFASFILFLSLGRVWAWLFSAPEADKRKIDSWFSFEFNMLFLLIFSVNYAISHFFGAKGEQGILAYMLFSLGHLVYFFVCLQKKARPTLGVAYYWGVNIVLVCVLSFSATVVPSSQVVFKKMMDEQKQTETEKAESSEKEKTASEKDTIK